MPGLLVSSLLLPYHKPDFTLAYYELGMTHIAGNQLSLALTAFQKAIELHFAYAPLYYEYSPYWTGCCCAFIVPESNFAVEHRLCLLDNWGSIGMQFTHDQRKRK